MAFVRLGLETARVPHSDRHGLMWLERGNLFVKDGTLRFISAGSASLDAGAYDIPYQTVSMILLGPGTTISHDVFRLAGSHGLGLIAVGENGVRLYTAPPQSPDTSELARRQMKLWANAASRMKVVLRMYEIRFGEALPSRNIEVLRGIEGTRVRESYKLLARRYGIDWSRRQFDRQNPEKTTASTMRSITPRRRFMPLPAWRSRPRRPFLSSVLSMNLPITLLRWMWPIFSG